MRHRRWLALAWTVTLLTVVQTPPSSAASGIAVHDRETQPVFALSDAIRETVYVEAPMDSDRDGRRDRIAVELLRPRETAGDLQVPVIVQASPYYGPRLRGVGAQLLDPADGAFPSSYADFFVPRGYAVAAVAMQGTNRSDGCPTTGGPEDTLSAKAAVEWLAGGGTATYADGSPVLATWSTGSVGMVGLSYDGTLANAVAAEGTRGLKTIVPLAAISSWYDYARDQGIGRAAPWGPRYPEQQAHSVINPAAVQRCAAVLKELGDSAGDATDDYTRFWVERNYRRHADRVRASVLMVQGLGDQKVLGRQFADWWQDLARHGVARKLWLHTGDHVDPSTVRPAEWQRTLHHWMDHWLYGIENGIMTEPMVDIQRPDGSWETHADWPEPGTDDVRLWFGAGTLDPHPAALVQQSFTDEPAQAESAMLADPGVAKPNRLAYRTPPLPQPTRISGTPRMSVTAAADRTSTPLTALLVDYDPAAPTGRPVTANDKPPPGSGPLPIVSRGALDTKNRYSLRFGQPLQPGRPYLFDWELQATDHVFPAGHRIGLILVANDNVYIAQDPAGATVTVHLTSSALTLPISPNPA